MAKSKRTKALDISPTVKKRVWHRDSECCIICGNPQAMPNSHYIRRAQGGLGIEQNVVTMCIKCHNEYDNGSGDYREYIRQTTEDYLRMCYPDWDPEKLVYRKW